MFFWQVSSKGTSTLIVVVYRKGGHYRDFSTEWIDISYFIQIKANFFSHSLESLVTIVIMISILDFYSFLPCQNSVSTFLSLQLWVFIFYQFLEKGFQMKMGKWLGDI